MLLLFLTFGLFFRGLGKLVQPDALSGSGCFSFSPSSHRLPRCGIRERL